MPQNAARFDAEKYSPAALGSRYYNEKDGFTVLNTVALHGRHAAAPELKYSPNDIAVASFSLAVNSGHGDKQKVAFIDCVAWRGTAEFICKYFAKGQGTGLSGVSKRKIL